MRDVRRWLFIVSALIPFLLLTGCGSALSTSTACLSPTTSTQCSPSPSTQATPPEGKSAVLLRLDALRYAPNAVISVTVSNESQQSIVFPDHLTNCTVILLQRAKVQPQATREQAGVVNPCRLAIPTRLHVLGPGQRLIVTLVAPQSGWTAGLYVATLSYRPSSLAGPATTISSPAFTVGPSEPLYDGMSGPCTVSCHCAPPGKLRARAS